MNNKPLPFLPVLISGILLAVIGWAGLAAIFIFTLPNLGPRWLFFFLGLLAFSGTALPIVYFLNRRFPSTPPVDSSIIIRQALWLGIYFDLLAWLQLGRVLNLMLGIFLAAGFILVEFLLRLRERARFKPPEASAEAPNE